MKLYVMTGETETPLGPLTEMEVIEAARAGTIHSRCLAAPVGAQEWQPMESVLKIPRFYSIQTPIGPRRMTQQEVEREYLLGTLPPTSYYQDNGSPRYIDTLVTDQAKAERARLHPQNPPSPASGPDDEWEKSHCYRGAYIGLALLLGGLGVHSFYAGRMEGALHFIIFLLAIAFFLGGNPDGFAVAWVLVAINYIIILGEICCVEFDGKGCKLQ
jgi:hypothetical protein